MTLEREPNTEYVLSLSYGKDSLACLGAIEELGRSIGLLMLRFGLRTIFRLICLRW